MLTLSKIYAVKTIHPQNKSFFTVGKVTKLKGGRFQKMTFRREGAKTERSAKKEPRRQ